MPTLRRALEEHGWDGDWYRRAFFDDGTPLGSAAQRGMPDRLDRAVVGVLSGAGDPERATGRWPPSTNTWSAATTA